MARLRRTAAAAEVSSDMAGFHRVRDHSDDLTHERVIDTFLAGRGTGSVKVKEPSDPLTDVAFMRVLTDTDDFAPTRDWLNEDSARATPLRTRLAYADVPTGRSRHGRCATTKDKEAP